MQAIKIIRGVGASGKSLEAGKTYKVPEEVSLKDAQIIVGMKKAVIVELPAAKEASPEESGTKKKKQGWGK